MVRPKMDLEYSEQQRLLRDAANRFLSRRYDGEARRRIVDTPCGFDPEMWSSFAKLGWLGLPRSELYGGLGGDPVDLCILMEAFGRSLVIEPYIPVVVLGCGLIELLASREVAGPLLDKVMRGSCRVALAHAEGNGPFDIDEIRTTATQGKNGWRLDGEKLAVIGGAVADRYLVSARLRNAASEAAEMGIFMIDSQEAGVSQIRYRTVDDRGASNLRLSRVAVPASALLGQGVRAVRAIETVLDHALIASSAFAVGSMLALLEVTIEYARQRRQFGRSLTDFQVLRHRLVDMAVCCEEARSVTLLAALKVTDAGIDLRRAAAAARIKVGRCGRFVAEQAVQLHGAMGCTQELKIGSYYKGLLGYELTFGSTEEHLGRYARFRQAQGKEHAAVAD